MNETPKGSTNAEEANKTATTTDAATSQQLGLATAMAELAGISSIRNIIFGEQIREYDEGFINVRQDLKDLRQFAEEQFAKLYAEMSQKLQGSQAELTEKIIVVEKTSEKNLSEKTDDLYEHLVAQIDDLQRQLQEQLETTESQLTHHITIVEEKSEEHLVEKSETLNIEFVTQINELRVNTSQNITVLQQNLEAEVKDLTNTKLDRVEFAKTLINFGSNLRSIAGQWEQIAEESSDEPEGNGDE
jgi:primosomal protein N''